MSMINGPLVPLEQVGVRVPLRCPPVLTLVSENLDTRWIDGRNWMLLEDFDFASEVLERIVCCKAGEITDFASTGMLRPVLSPTGPYGKGAVLHDHAYRTPGFCSRADADAMFLEAMEALGVNWALRHVMYAGVRAFGASSYKGGL